MAVKHDIILVGNLFVKQMHFEKAGDVMRGHSHKFDHPTLVGKGSVKVRVNGQDTEFKAPHMVYISKDSVHEITALEDGTTAYCIHPIRGEKQEDIYGHDQVPAGITHGVELLNPQDRALDTHFDDQR
jgi:quercetin dioxygenase-like cupin family protein